MNLPSHPQSTVSLGRRALVCAAFWVLLAAPPAGAEPEAPTWIEYEAPEVFDEPPEVLSRAWTEGCRQEPDDAGLVERAREQVEETVCSAVLWFDGLFGDRRNVHAARQASGFVETTLEQSQFYGFRFNLRFNLRVTLPNLEERVSVFIGRDNEDNIARDRAEGFALRNELPQIDDRDQFFAGIGYALPGTDRFRSDVRAGVRNLRLPRAFVQSRVEWLAYADDQNLVQLRLSPFYNTVDGFGLTPALDLSHVINPRLLLRWNTVATLTERNRAWDWRSAWLLYQGIGWERGLAYEAFVRGLAPSEVPLREYGLRLIYRMPAASRKLYLEPLVGYSWPQEEPDAAREGAYLVGVGVQMPFGQR